MLRTAHDLIGHRANALEAVSSNPIIQSLPRSGINAHTERVKQHLSNPSCSTVCIGCNSPASWPDECVVFGIDPSSDQPFVMCQNLSTQWELRPVDGSDAAVGGTFTASEHLRDRFTDDGSTPFHVQPNFYNHAMSEEGRVRMKASLRRHHGVAVLSQLDHDLVEPDLQSWAQVLFIVHYGYTTCDIVSVMMSLENGEFALRKSSFRTPRWSPIKLLPLNSRLSTEYALSKLQPKPLPSFWRAYKTCLPPQSKEELMAHWVTEVVQHVHRCSCHSENGCANIFLAELQRDMDGFPDDSVVIAAQRLWTSYKTDCSGREFCSMLNEATRPGADDALAEAGAFVTRAINANLVVNVNKTSRKRFVTPLEKREGFLGTCWRGGGFPSIHKAFFDKHSHQKIRVPNFLATSFRDDATVTGFLQRAHEKGDHCIKWQIELPSRGGQWYCAHVNYIDHQVQGLSDEGEFLFVPYSVFTIKDIAWSDDPTPEKPHVIKLIAAEDNMLEPEDLPLAPWS